MKSEQFQKINITKNKYNYLYKRLYVWVEKIGQVDLKERVGMVAANCQTAQIQILTFNFLPTEVKDNTCINLMSSQREG